MYKRILKPLLFGLEPERAHRAALNALHVAAALPPARVALSRATRAGDPTLAIVAFGMRFRNPVGLAAGFDKNGRHARALQHLGFGFIEVGSITAGPTPGNPAPRLFRLPGDGALINRMGLNNEGAEVIAARLAAIRSDLDVPLFANVALTPGATNDTEAAIADYASAVWNVHDAADAVVLNVSCPNTGDGRTFEDPLLLTRLLVAVHGAMPRGKSPLLVKLSTDLDRGLLAEAVDVVARSADGLVIANTTTCRDALRASPDRLARIGEGGVSGRPLFARALEALRFAADRVGGRLPIIGVGGIASADDARAYLEAGATLVQLYTGLVYEGPLVVKRICAGLDGVCGEAVASSRRARSARREA